MSKWDFIEITLPPEVSRSARLRKTFGAASAVCFLCLFTLSVLLSCLSLYVRVSENTHAQLKNFTLPGNTRANGMWRSTSQVSLPEKSVAQIDSRIRRFGFELAGVDASQETHSAQKSDFWVFPHQETRKEK